MKFKCLKPVIHMGKPCNVGDIIDIDEKVAKESPTSFSKVEVKKKNGNTTTNSN